VADLGRALGRGIDALEQSLDWLLGAMADPRLPGAASVPFLKLCGIVCGGWLMTDAARLAAARLADGAADDAFYQGKLASARFYGANVLPTAQALAEIVIGGTTAVAALDSAVF